jgi:hypothetical protein
MLSISDRIVPAGETVYAAFRLAFLDTMERIALAEQLDVGDRSFGYLTQVPFLKNVHPGVQLEQLLRTWAKHLGAEVHPANLCEEAVLYSVCETAAQVIRTDRQTARRVLSSGPVSCTTTCDLAFADHIQKFHVNLIREGHFLLLSQFQDIPPREAERLKRDYGLNSQNTDCLFDLLGRYRVSPLLTEWTRGLITANELRDLLAILRASKSRWATT